MSSIHMITKMIRFSEFEKNAAQIAIHQDSIAFPSNVINCGFRIVQNTLSTKIPPEKRNDTPEISCLGAGVNNITYNGTQVYFTAWIEAMESKSSEFTIDLQMDLNASYLTVLAIAECE